MFEVVSLWEVCFWWFSTLILLQFLYFSHISRIWENAGGLKFQVILSLIANSLSFLSRFSSSFTATFKVVTQSLVMWSGLPLDAIYKFHKGINEAAGITSLYYFYIKCSYHKVHKRLTSFLNSCTSQPDCIGPNRSMSVLRNCGSIPSVLRFGRLLIMGWRS